LYSVKEFSLACIGRAIIHPEYDSGTRFSHSIQVEVSKTANSMKDCWRKIAKATFVNSKQRLDRLSRQAGREADACSGAQPPIYHMDLTEE